LWERLARLFDEWAFGWGDFAWLSRWIDHHDLAISDFLAVFNVDLAFDARLVFFSDLWNKFDEWKLFARLARIKVC
jgi:hypothetical protein